MPVKEMDDCSLRGFSVKKILKYGNDLEHLQGKYKNEGILPKASFPLLLVGGMDHEQVWQQLQNCRTNRLPAVSNIQSRSDVSFAQRTARRRTKINEAIKDVPDDPLSDPESDEELKAFLERVSNDRGARVNDERELVGDDEYSDEADDKSVEEEDDASGDLAIQKKPSRVSEVDDNFFKLSEMEDFLESEDAKENKRRKLEERGEEESGEDDDELFDDLSDDQDGPSGAAAKFTDLFGSSSPAEKKKSVRFQEEQKLRLDSDSDDSSVGDMEETPFAKKQKKMQERINTLEEGSLKPRPWHLMGEATATKRPENSLLEVDVDTVNIKATRPVRTEETIKTIQDLIKQRVRDKAWDDVIRKVRPVDTVHEFKKTAVLDDQSKKSLADIYEAEYLQQTQPSTEKENPQHEEIKKSMRELFAKLDALSNFNFTPGIVAPEFKLIKNISSMTREEVTPIVITEECYLAPEEVRNKRSSEKAKSERTDTDKLRERRLKKKSQKVKKTMREKKTVKAKIPEDAGSEKETLKRKRKDDEERVGTHPFFRPKKLNKKTVKR